jgi:hypothetical protein
MIYLNYHIFLEFDDLVELLLVFFEYPVSSHIRKILEFERGLVFDFAEFLIECIFIEGLFALELLLQRFRILQNIVVVSAHR